MAEEKNNNKKEMLCGTHGLEECIGCWMGKHHLLRFIIKILVVLFIFWLGVKIGEFKSLFNDGYYGSRMYRGGYNMMYPYNMMSPYYNDSYYQYYPGMMRNLGTTNTQPQQQTTPTK